MPLPSTSLDDSILETLAFVPCLAREQVYRVCNLRPSNRKTRKASRRLVRPTLQRLKEEGLIKTYRILSPWFEANQLVMGDVPLLHWQPGWPPPPFELFDRSAVISLDTGAFLASSEGVPVFPGHPLFGKRDATVLRLGLHGLSGDWDDVQAAINMSSNILQVFEATKSGLDQYASRAYETGHASRLVVVPPPKNHPTIVPYETPPFFLSEHQLHVPELYMRYLEQSAGTSIRWERNQSMANATPGTVPDALIGEKDSPMRTAWCYGGPLTSVCKIHEFCAGRNMPYMIWANVFDKHWYNPAVNDANTMRIRERLVHFHGTHQSITVLHPTEWNAE